MRSIISISLALFCYIHSFGQSANPSIRKGNELYKQKDYAGSLQLYNKALAAEPNNALASYNNGNALFRSGKGEEAVAAYDKTAEQTKDNSLKEKSLYNKGVALAKQQKLQESIDAWKDALKLNADDNEARENLQKAMAELKKQQQQQQDKQNKEQEKKQQQQKDKQQQQPKPQEQQSKLNKQQVEQLLRAMQQKEKEIQQKLQKGNPQTNRPEKDW
jgi:Ca-activated chloride channel family protein